MKKDNWKKERATKRRALKFPRAAYLLVALAVVAVAAFTVARANKDKWPQAAESAENFRYTNRLIHEKSPYLLMHAHNPVDWYPWGEEAFAKAKRENKPIFLSVRLFHLSLVPRDGAGVVLEPSSSRADEPMVCLHQG